MSKSDGSGKGFRTFWTTLPGLLTAIAAILTAVVGLAGVFWLPNGSSSGADDGVSHAEWVHRADLLCSRTIELVRALPPVDESTVIGNLSAISSVQRDLAEKLRTMEAPEEDQLLISQLTSLLDQQRNEIDAALIANEEAKEAIFRHRIQRMESFEPKVNKTARALDIDACAQRPTAVGASSF